MRFRLSWLETQVNEAWWLAEPKFDEILDIVVRRTRERVKQNDPLLRNSTRVRGLEGN